MNEIKEIAKRRAEHSRVDFSRIARRRTRVLGAGSVEILLQSDPSLLCSWSRARRLLVANQARRNTRDFVSCLARETCSVFVRSSAAACCCCCCFSSLRSSRFAAHPRPPYPRALARRRYPTSHALRLGRRGRGAQHSRSSLFSLCCCCRSSSCYTTTCISSLVISHSRASAV